MYQGMSGSEIKQDSTLEGRRTARSEFASYALIVRLNCGSLGVHDKVKFSMSQIALGKRL